MSDINGYYQLSIHPTRINYYYTPFHRRSRVKATPHDYEENYIDASGQVSHSGAVAPQQPEQFKSNSHNGKVSKIAERKITRAIDYITYLAQPKSLPHTLHGKGLSFRLNFVTLTLSSNQIHSDHDIMYGIFRPFLLALHRRWQVNNYVWRAEKQENGSLHFHLVTDKFIPWNELRNVWNRCQQNLGYVTRYRENQILWHREGFRCNEKYLPKWPRAQQIKAYKDGVLHDWNSPNSTDIHSIKLISNVKAYFVKYMTKSKQSTDVTCRLWGCSLQLSRISGATVAVYNKIDSDLAKINQDKSIKVYISDFYTVILITILQLTLLGCTELLIVWEEYLASEFPQYRPPGLFT